MIDYKLPEIKIKKFKFPKIKFPNFLKNKFLLFLIFSIFLSSLFGFLAGTIAGGYFYYEVKSYLSRLNIELPEKIVEREKIIEKEYVPQTSQEQAIIKVVKETSPSVVGIVVTQYLPLLEPYYYEPFKEFEEFFGEPLFEFKIPQYRQKGVEKKESLIGTGFIVSEDGMILTNRHVVADETAEYTVLMTDGRKFPAKILAKDKIRDIAILKIENSEALPVAKLGDSKNLQIGQTVIAIGNALGEFQNTVSVGVISGLGRTITASGGGIIETLEDVIQTDAAINRGNSGGPLLNLKGEVIGINTAMSLEGENIGFAIPINQAKKDITQVKTLGKIVYPYLGVYYCLITDQVQEKYNLPVNYGAWIGRDKYCNPYDKAVIPGTAAEKAGLQRNDIILEFNGEKITPENSLAKIIMDYNPGDKVVLKVLRGEEEKIFQATLGEMSP